MHLKKFQRNGVYKLVLFVKRMCLIKGYRIAGKFGGKMFGEIIDQPKGY